MSDEFGVRERTANSRRLRSSLVTSPSAWPFSRLVTMISLAAFVLSLTGSWIPSLWGDEAASIMSATRSIPSLMAMLGSVDAVHGTYYLFLHVWISFFGASPFSVRLPSAVAVGAIVAAIMLIAHRLGSRQIAITAGIICTVIPRVMYFGEEARAYAFSAAIAAWLTLLLVTMVAKRNPSRRWWVGYSVLLALGIYNFLFVILLVISHAIILATVRPDKRFVLRWSLSTTIGVFAASPLIVFAVREKHQIAFLTHANEINFYKLTVPLWFGDPVFATIAWSLILCALCAAIIGLRRRRQGQTEEGFPLPRLDVVASAWLIIPGAILIGGFWLIPVYTARYLSFCVPAAALLMAIGLDWVLRGRRKAFAAGLTVVVLCAIPAWVTQRQPNAKNNSDYAETSLVISTHASPGDGIVFDESARPSRRPRLALHTYPEAFAGLKDVTLKVGYDSGTSWYDTAYTVSDAATLGRFAGVRRVWLIEYIGTDSVDTTSRPQLASLGYVATRRYLTHRSAIYEYVLEGVRRSATP